MARHIRRQDAAIAEEKSFMKKNKKALMALAVLAIAAGAFYYMKYGKKSAPAASRLRYYYF